MQVWELMHILSEVNAGREVLVSVKGSGNVSILEVDTGTDDAFVFVSGESAILYDPDGNEIEDVFSDDVAEALAAKETP